MKSEADMRLQWHSIGRDRSATISPRMASRALQRLNRQEVKEWLKSYPGKLDGDMTSKAISAFITEDGARFEGAVAAGVLGNFAKFHFDQQCRARISTRQVTGVTTGNQRLYHRLEELIPLDDESGNLDIDYPTGERPQHTGCGLSLPARHDCLKIVGIPSSWDYPMFACIRRHLPLLVFALLAGCESGTGPGTVPPAQITVVAGDAQSAIVGTALDTLIVKAVDAHGVGVAGVKIQWSSTGDGVIAASSTTDAAGEARVAWTLPTTTGPHTARAVHGNHSVDFTAHAWSTVALPNLNYDDYIRLSLLEPAGRWLAYAYQGRNPGSGWELWSRAVDGGWSLESGFPLRGDNFCASSGGEVWAVGPLKGTDAVTAARSRAPGSWEVLPAPQSAGGQRGSIACTGSDVFISLRLVDERGWVNTTAVFRLDESGWTELPLRTDTIYGDLQLTGLAARGRDDLYAGGYLARPGGTRAWAGRWDGTEWKEIPMPGDGSQSHPHLTALKTRGSGFPVYGNIPELVRLDGDQAVVQPYPVASSPPLRNFALGEDGHPAVFADVQRALVLRNGTWREYVYPGEWDRLTALELSQSGILTVFVHRAGPWDSPTVSPRIFQIDTSR